MTFFLGAESEQAATTVAGFHIALEQSFVFVAIQQCAGNTEQQGVGRGITPGSLRTVCSLWCSCSGCTSLHRRHTDPERHPVTR